MKSSRNHIYRQQSFLYDGPSHAEEDQGKRLDRCTWGHASWPLIQELCIGPTPALLWNK